MNKMKVIPNGAIFTVTTGEYSDYYTLSLCKALKEINPRDMQNEYLSEYPNQQEQYCMQESTVVNWMINVKGYAEEMEFFELHIGSYGNADFNISSRERE